MKKFIVITLLSIISTVSLCQVSRDVRTNNKLVRGVSTTTGNPVSVIKVTNTQAVLAYTAPSTSPCTVEVSESPTYSPLVNDVNSALYTNANSDVRDDALTNGTSRVFTVGTRKVQTALDTNKYSRALQTDTIHYYRVCGTYTGTFTTKTMPVGMSRNDLPTLSTPGYWDTPTLTGSRNQVIIDPLTGTKYVRQTIASDVLGSPNFGFIQGYGGLSRPHTNTMYTSGDGQQGYVSCYWDDNAGGNMYFFIPATGETRFIGNVSGVVYPEMRDDKTFVQYRPDLTPVGIYRVPYTGTFMSGDYATGTPVLNQANTSGGPCTALNIFNPTAFPTPFTDYECVLIPTAASEYTSFFLQNTGYPRQDAPGVEGVFWGGDGRPYDPTCSAGPTACPHIVAAYIIGSPSNPNGCTNHNNELNASDIVKLNLKSNDGTCIGGYASVVFWNFPIDPDGSGIVNGPWGFGGHDDIKGPGPFSPNGTGGGFPNGPIARVEEASSFCPGGPNGCAYDVVIGNPQSGTITTTPTTAIGVYNAFAISPSASVFGLVRHPNWEADPLQSSTDNASTFWDAIPYGGGGGILAASVTLVSGKTRTYKFVGTGPLHVKQQDTVAKSAGLMLQDISTPTLNALCDNSGCGGQYCVANASNECITGSVAGDIYFNPQIPLDILDCTGSETTNLGYSDICIVDTSLHMTNIAQFWGLGGVDASDKSRMLGHAIAKSVAYMNGGVTAKPYPDTSWVTTEVGYFGAVDPSHIWAMKVPSYPVSDGKNRTTFLSASVPVTTPTGLGISTATVQFWYTEYSATSERYCTSRRESCATGLSTINPTTPFQYTTTDSPVRLSCATSCTLTLPVLPMHIAHYTVKYYDGSGVYVTDGPSGVAVEDETVSVGTIAASSPIGFGAGTLSVGLVDMFDWYIATPSGCTPGANEFCVGTNPTGDTIYATGWAANASALPVTSGLPIIATLNDFSYGGSSGNLMVMQLAAFDWSNRNASKVALINLMTSYGTSGATPNTPAGWFGHCTNGDNGTSNGCSWKSRDPFVRGGNLYLPVERQIPTGVTSVHDATMIMSTDMGQTWKNPYTIAHSGSASATGDAPLCNAMDGNPGSNCTDPSYPGSIMWPALGFDSSNWHIIHYMQDGATPPTGVNDGCDPSIYTCAMLGESSGIIGRVLNTNLPNLDVSQWQYWTCPTLTNGSICDGSSGNWTSNINLASKAFFSVRDGNRSINLAEIFGIAWIKEFKAYLLTGSMYRDGGVNAAYMWAPTIQGPWTLSLVAPPVSYGMPSSTLLFPGFIAPNLALGYNVISTSPPHVQLTAVMDTAAYTAQASPLFGKLDLVAGSAPILQKGTSPRSNDVTAFTLNAGYEISSSGASGTIPSTGLLWAFDMLDQAGDSTVSGFTGFTDVANGSSFMAACTSTVLCYTWNPGQGTNYTNFGASLVNGGYGAVMSLYYSPTNTGTKPVPTSIQGNGTYTVVSVFRRDAGFSFGQTPIWVAGDNSGSNTEVAVSYDSTAGANLELGWGVSNNRWRYVSPFTMTAGNWYFVATTVTAGSPNPLASIWVGVGGSLVDEISGVSRTSTGGTPTQTPNVASTKFNIGLENGSTTNITGSYASMFAYDRVLNTTELNLLYQSMITKMAARGITLQ